MSSSQVKVSDDSLDVKLGVVEQQLEELLVLLDKTAGCEIVALHIDQAINALKDCHRQRPD